MEQFQYLSLSSSSTSGHHSRVSSTASDEVCMPPLSPLHVSSPVAFKHENDPFAFDWTVKREPGLITNHGTGHGTIDEPDCAPSPVPSSTTGGNNGSTFPASLFQSLSAFALPSLPPIVDHTNDWSLPSSAAAATTGVSAVPSVRFAATPSTIGTSAGHFTFDLSSYSAVDSSSAPSSPVSRRGSVITAASSAASSRAASPASPWSAGSEYDDDVASPVPSSPSSSVWSPSSSHGSSVSSPSNSSIRSSLSAFRGRTTSVSSSSSSIDDDIVDCDVDADSLSPLADAAAASMKVSPAIVSSNVVKPVAKTSSSETKRVVASSTGVRKVTAAVGPTGLPVTPMCSPSSCDAIAAAAGRSLREVGRYSIHYMPDCDNPRPPKAKATPLNIYFAPNSSSSTSLVPVRIRLRPQAPRSFRNVVKTARTYTTMHGVAPPADASDKDPSHFLYFSITAMDSQTKLAGPQAAHVQGRGSKDGNGSATTTDRTRRQAKFKHADDKKEYQGHVQLDLSQPGDGARLEVRLYSAMPIGSNGVPRFHVVTGSCDHKFAHMYVSDLSSNTSNRV